MTDGWSEDAFRQRVLDRAEELGITLPQLFSEAGLSHDWLRHNATTRKIDTLEKLAKQLNWSLSEIMGYSMRIDSDLSALAFSAARRMMGKLPAWARTDENRVAAHATVYDLLIGLKEDRKLPEAREKREDLVAQYVQILVRAWEDRPAPTQKPEPVVKKRRLKATRPRLLVPGGG